MKKGLVVKSISGEYSVYSDNNIEICKPRGVFRHNEINVKVGDYVDYEDKIIYRIYDRKNDLERPVIANVDKVFIVTSISEPDLNLNLLDKMLSVIEYNDIEPIIIFSKYDLKMKCHDFDKICSYYQNLGYKIIITSFDSTTNNDYKEVLFKEIIPLLDNSIAVLTGQSGVGKTTILNQMDESLKQKTDEISKALGRGKHTTRHIELFRLGNGFIADSPGFGNMSFEEIDNLTLSQTFREFYQYSKECKYLRCTHINEPKCKIKELVNEGIILSSRYENYLLFTKEIQEMKKKKY